MDVDRMFCLMVLRNNLLSNNDKDNSSIIISKIIFLHGGHVELIIGPFGVKHDKLVNPIYCLCDNKNENQY
jgi:hypothetical protein